MCDWWYNFECEDAPFFYPVNAAFVHPFVPLVEIVADRERHLYGPHTYGPTDVGIGLIDPLSGLTQHDIALTDQILAAGGDLNKFLNVNIPQLNKQHDSKGIGSIQLNKGVLNSNKFKTKIDQKSSPLHQIRGISSTGFQSGISQKRKRHNSPLGASSNFSDFRNHNIVSPAHTGSRNRNIRRRYPNSRRRNRLRLNRAGINRRKKPSSSRPAFHAGNPRAKLISQRRLPGSTN